MEPFRVSPECRTLKDQYPPPEVLARIGPKLSEREKHGFFRLWVSEGIPFAFRELPMLYEAVREGLGDRLRVHPKKITLIGSARLGYSLASSPSYGRAYDANSDLDFVLVSDRLLSDLANNFWQWKADFEEGRVRPATPEQERYWPANAANVPSNLRRGFIDGNKVPYMFRYSTAQQIGETMSWVKRKLGKTPGAPPARRASIRIYLNWDSLAGQFFRTFQYMLSSLRPK